MKIKIILLAVILFFLLLLVTSFGQDVEPTGIIRNSQESQKNNGTQVESDKGEVNDNQKIDLPQDIPPEKLTLTEAYMCEAVTNLVPVNPAVVFSISGQSVCCYSAFDPVPEKTIVYHKWYRKDRLSTTQSLSLDPPRWNTFSSIQLREADKGPWRVEIIGPKGQIMKILRFSITD